MNKTEMLDKSFHLLTQAEAERDAARAEVARLRAVVNAARLLRTTSQGYMANACQPTWIRLSDAQFAFDVAVKALTQETP